MFGKGKKAVKEEPVTPTSVPQVADELQEEYEEQEAPETQEEVETPEETELTEAQIRVILENMAADIAKIKYHLRLDF